MYLIIKIILKHDNNIQEFDRQQPAIVFSRLAFHHFTDVTAVFSEMVRVLKPGGKLVMIDMEAADEVLRKTEDEIETQRDPSHVKILSKTEMLSLFETHGLAIAERIVIVSPGFFTSQGKRRAAHPSEDALPAVCSGLFYSRLV